MHPLSSRSRRIHLPSRSKIAFLVLFCLFLSTASSDAQTVTINSNVVGNTPRVIGLNSGNFIPGANTTSFWRWSGVNGARIFTSAPNIEQQDDIPGHGDGVDSEASFLARRAAVRANPTDPSLINFAEFEDGYQNNLSGFIKFDLAYGELSSNDIRPLAIINRTEGQFPFAANGTAIGWADRWEHWQHYYAQAYYLGSNFDVERYSMYNEPDAGSQDVTQEDFLNRLQLASDAIQGALQDVNRDFGKSLQPNIMAPITAGGANEYFARTDNSDTRDDNQGWGELVINNLNTNFLGQTDSSFQLIHTYGYQQYNQDGRRYAEDLGFIQQEARRDIADNGLTGEVQFGLTEFNVHSNGVFSGRSDDLNTPSRYARLGGIFTGLANQQADELYLFKFDSNAEDDFLQKNGIFTNSRFDAPYNVGGATSAAGVLKLFTKGFVGSKLLMEEADHNVNNLDVATSFDPSNETYYVLSANESTNDRNLTFDLSSLGVGAGAIVQIEEVSAGNIAEVTGRFAIPGNGQIDIEQSGESVLLISVPTAASASVLELTPTDDATVRAGNNINNNAGASNNVFVRNVTDGPNGRAVGLLQFDTSGIGNSIVSRAVLEVFGEVNEGSADSVTTHVFAIRGDDWDEDTVTWNDVNNLLDSQGSATEIADNFVTGVSESAEFVGHLTFSQDTETVAVDITEFLLANPDNELRLLIAREVRVDGENVDRSVGAVRFDSKDSAGGTGPRLILELDEGAEPPVVAGVELNTGEAQRSSIESISFRFDGDVLLESGAVSVVQRSTATAATFVPVSTSVTQQLINGQTIATVRFNSHVRNSDGALVDGNYQVTLTGDLVSRNGVPMSEDFVFGSVASDGFFAWFGDSDGNRTINVFDLLVFRRAFGAFVGDTAYEFFMDFNASGSINVFDLLPFRIRFGNTLPFTFGSSLKAPKESFKAPAKLQTVKPTSVGKLEIGK